MLVVWNHGSGLKGISFDDLTKKHISVGDLKHAMKRIGKVDVYGSDACLMQMGAIAAELKDYADVIIGSEDIEPEEGWDYDALLTKLSANPRASAEEAAKYVVDGFRRYYSKRGRRSSLSAIRAPALDGLAERVNMWTDRIYGIMQEDSLETQGTASALYMAWTRALRFPKSDSVDLCNFVGIVSMLSPDEQLKAMSSDMLKYVAQELVVANASVMYRAYGIAAYMPAKKYNEGYETFQWARMSGWGDFSRFMDEIFNSGIILPTRAGLPKLPENNYGFNTK
ncbi:MAG: clostripain-related cysteine peptidase [bacterium]